MKNKPFKQEKIDDKTIIREFFEETDSEELVWHRDKEDRLIEPIDKNNWLYQEDNKLPIPINEKILIPKEVYHRVIKGTGNLKIK